MLAGRSLHLSASNRLLRSKLLPVYPPIRFSRLLAASITIGIRLSPSELIEKLIALIPPRRSPLVRYGGVFAPNFKRRDEIILVPGKRKRKVSLRPEGTEKSVKSKVASGSWARLLKRVFAIDVSRCPRCGADLEIIAAVLDPIQIARYLKHTGMPAAPPARAGVKMRLANDEWC